MILILAKELMGALSNRRKYLVAVLRICCLASLMACSQIKAQTIYKIEALGPVINLDIQPGGDKPVINSFTLNKTTYQVGDKIVMNWSATNQHHVGIYLWEGENEISLLHMTDRTNDNGIQEHEWTITEQVLEEFPPHTPHQLDGDNYRIKLVVWNADDENAQATPFFSDVISIRPENNSDAPRILEFNINRNTFAVGEEIKMEWQATNQHHVGIYLWEGENEISLLHLTDETNDNGTQEFNWTVLEEVKEEQNPDITHTLNGDNYRIKLVVWDSGDANTALFDEAFSPLVTFTTSQADDCEVVKDFTDLSKTHYAYCIIQSLVQAGLLEGDGNTGFSTIRPDAQVNRAELAKLAFLGIGQKEEESFGQYLPVPFVDLQDKSEAWYFEYAKTLSYLQFSDGITPYDHEGTNFLPDRSITRAHVLKVLLESWNIPLTTGTDLPFTDVDTNHDSYTYIYTAWKEGIIQGDANEQVTFRPNDNATRAEVFVITHRLFYHESINQPSVSEGDFYLPGNITPLTLARPPSVTEGYFTYESPAYFSIPGINLPLTFSHSYNSFYHELPQELRTGNNDSQIPLKPLGSGWSHSFNAYILDLEEQDNQAERWAVVWPDGAFHFYREEGTSLIGETLGVFDELERISATEFRLTSKSQIRYTFKKLTGSDVSFPFVLTAIEDRNFNRIQVVYSSGSQNGTYRIREVIGTAGRKLQFNYWSNSDLVSSVRGPSGRVVRFAFDSRDNTTANLIEFTDTKGNKETYQYTDVQGFDLLSQLEFPDGNIVTNQYDERLRKLKYSKNEYAETELTLTHSFNYTDVGGDFTNTEIRDENSHIYTVKRNFSNRINEFKTPFGLNTYEYDNSPFLPSTVTGLDNIKTDYDFDAKGNVLHVHLPLGVEHQFTYNSRNDVITYTDPNGNITSYEYDAKGNLIGVETPENGETKFVRFSNGLLKQLITPEGIAISFTYDNYGNLIRTEAPEGIRSQATYDILGRVEKAFNNAGQEILYEYDAYDNLISNIDPLGYKTRYIYNQQSDVLEAIVNAKNRATSLKYDNQDRLIEERFEGSDTDYEYDSQGFLKSYTDPANHTFEMQYDNERRLTNNGQSQFTYDDNNNIKTVRGPDNKVITYNYDGLNRITSVDYDGETIGYQYDKNGNLILLTYEAGKAVQYTYDQENRLTQVKDWEGNTATYTYLLDGRLATMTYPNGINETYQYDDAGRMTGFKSSLSNGSLFYQYGYLLDPTGRHLKEDYEGDIGQSTQQQEANISYQYNTANRIQQAGDITFDFDANGNTIRKGDTQFSYDLWNNLTHLTRADQRFEYSYDGLGNRRAKTVNNATTRYTLDILGLSRVLIEHLQEDKKNYYIYGLGLISRLDQDAKASYYHYDFRGSTIALTSEAEEVTHEYTYGAFGELLNEIEADPNPFKFVGKYGIMHEADEFYFMRARYYDADIGRFLSEDPIWSTNLYAYGDNDPINKLDHTGEVAETVFDVASIGYSSYEFSNDPSLENGLFLVWDVAAAALPFVPGSYVARGGRAVSKVVTQTAGKVDGVLNAAKGVRNVIPEGKLANHLFKGANKLADTPANRALIQKISNGKPLGVDQYGKSWFAKILDNGTQIYTYTRNGVVKGAGTNQTPVDIIARYGLK